MALLTSRRLAPLLITQTLTAVNDNLFKNALVLLVLLDTASGGPALVAAAGGVFILPYVFLSALAGDMADRAEKREMILRVKRAEIALMLAAAVGFWSGSTALLFAVLFGLGVQATFFGPLKYGVLPSYLAEHELVAGNGLMEAGVFGGILAGTIAGGALFALPGGRAVVSLACIAIAAAGYGAARALPPAPPEAAAGPPGWNLIGQTARLLAAARANRPVWFSILALSWFWVVGATLLAELPGMVKTEIGGGATVVTLLLAFFSGGVGLGSVVCARLLKGEVSARLVPVAALGIAAFTWDFPHAMAHAGRLADIRAVLGGPGGWRILADLTALSACGGIYSVPLYALMQEKSPASHRARMVGANNVMNAAAMAAAAGITAALALHGTAPAAVMEIAALATVLVAGWAALRAPPRPVPLP